MKECYLTHVDRVGLRLGLALLLVELAGQELSVLSESEAEFTVNMTIERRGWLIMFHHGARNVSQFLCLPGGQS